jgi:hypothetical protein
MSLRRRRQLGAAREEAGRRTANTGRQMARGVRRGAARAAPIVTTIASLPIVIAAALLSALARLGGLLMRAVDGLSVAIKPEYALAAVAAACCAALAGAQFVDYSGVVVDAGAYGGKLGTIAPAPVASQHLTGTAHAYALLPVAAIGLILIALTLAGRWRFGRLVALCGLIGLGVALIVDLPKGLDTGRAGLAYSGTAARLEGGFYVELAASAMLLLTGTLLATTVHKAHPEPRRPRARRGLRARRPESDPLVGT